MAISKPVKVGGINYTGYLLAVNSSPGAYVLDVSMAGNCAVNSVSITPEKYGPSDHYKLEHVINGNPNKPICSNVYNIGAGVTMNFDFAAMQMINNNEVLRLTYNNVASTAMSIYMHVERIGIRG